MSQSEALYQLQEIDLSILRSHKRLKEIAEVLANDEVLRAAQARVDTARNKLSPLRARSRDLELEMQSNESKRRNSEQQLYSGAIKNPKEMQDVEQEIEALKRRHSDLETMLLESMMAVEEAEEELNEAETHLENAAASQGDAHKQLLNEKSKLEVEITALGDRRESCVDAVQPENLKLYDLMRPRKHNQPIALMQDNTCSFCGVAQTMAIEREVRQEHGLVRCSNCDRILVYRN